MPFAPDSLKWGIPLFQVSDWADTLLFKRQAYFFLAWVKWESVIPQYVNIVNTKHHQSPGAGGVYVFASTNDFTFWILFVVDSVKRVVTWFQFFIIYTAIVNDGESKQDYSLKLNLYGDVLAVIYCGRNNEPQEQQEIVLC